MKGKLFTRAITLILAFFSIFSVSASATTGGDISITAPVFIVLDNTSQLSTEKDIHIRIVIDNPLGINFSAVSLNNKTEDGVETEVRTGETKDGKVDVDIIIRGGQLKGHVLPVKADPQVRVKISNLEFITVDNISGVYQAEATNGHIAGRLMQVNYTDDENGTISAISQSTIEIAPVVTINTRPIQEDVTLYPNPVKDGNLNLAFSNDVSVSLITVHNALGALVHQERPANGTVQKLSLSLSHLNTGVYFVRITTSTGDMVRKFNITQ